MRTDRELLESAAKGAGVKLLPYTWDKGAPWGSHDGFILDGGGPSEWNPIENDGDALRLAVKLRILVDYYERHSSTECACAAWSIAASGGAEHEEIGADPCAAARRAIVRAAAEIGKAMP